jgi:hypothetical protein
VCNILETEKMSLAVTAMSGCALKWWRWWSPCHPGVSWIVVPRVWFNFFDLIIWVRDHFFMRWLDIWYFQGACYHVIIIVAHPLLLMLLKNMLIYIRIVRVNKKSRLLNHDIKFICIYPYYSLNYLWITLRYLFNALANNKVSIIPQVTNAL